MACHCTGSSEAKGRWHNIEQKSQSRVTEIYRPRGGLAASYLWLLVANRLNDQKRVLPR
jgi:hypothetical protein